MMKLNMEVIARPGAHAQCASYNDARYLEITMDDRGGLGARHA